MSRLSDPAAELVHAAHRFYGMGAFAEALASLGRLPAERRRDRNVLLLQGASLARAKRGEEAATVFSELLTLDPECHEALTWMAALRRAQDPKAALEYARRAVALRPDDAAGHGALGSSLLAAGSHEEAVEAVARAVALAPDVAEHRHNLAQAYRALHRGDEAVTQLREAIRLAPASPQNYLALASIYSLSGMAGPAIECLTEGLLHQPDSAPLHTAVAVAYASLRNDKAAERHHRRAVEISSEGRRGLGNWLVNQGRFAEADAIFEAMIQEESDPAVAYYGLMQSRKTVDDALVEGMEVLLRSDRLRPRGEMSLRYALGRAQEGRQRYPEAMAHFDAANRLACGLYHGGRRVDSERLAEERGQARRLFESIPPSEEASPEAPILIVGMIRSGTTLLDQIVSSHPLVASGGELRFWIEEARRLTLRGAAPSPAELRALADEYTGYARLLADTAGRFTDKMPLNFEQAGLIHRAMPDARLLHIRRHPVDTCLSIWTTFFGQGPAFAYDKASVVAYYREYLRAMDFWREVLPAERLFELDYEALIADPEPTIRSLIGFCGLPWDDACLRHDQNQGAINTPSRWQARQPIYRTSVERWRRYEPWLGEFAELLEEA